MLEIVARRESFTLGKSMKKIPVVKTKQGVVAKVTAVLTGTKVEAQKTIFRVPNDPGGDRQSFR